VRWAGFGKRDLKACVRTPNPGGRRSRRQEIRTFAITTNALLELQDWLVVEKVTLVVLEATGVYWRGAFYPLEDSLNVILVNAAHAKGLPGRKTDVSDAAWLCQMSECGLLKASFVPPEPIGPLRDLTRYRASGNSGDLGERTFSSSTADTRPTTTGASPGP
jgi:transposase